MTTHQMFEVTVNCEVISPVFVGVQMTIHICVG